MERQIGINEVRHFLEAALHQFDQGGILVDRVTIRRNEKGQVERILIDYEQKEQEDEK